MVHSPDFANIVDELSKIPLEEQEMLLEILQKRVIERRREEILKHSEESIEEYKKGLTSEGDVSDLIKELNND
ncbi:MAG TPA: hypothetical protein ACFYD2_03610 [Candidatus Avalokitesvara rifleensis]|uniref:hypothetical protein n=1 Tax=Candidatus Avalokitesvara rifleensis TaxID=3367620 RepID=UPI00402919B9